MQVCLRCGFGRVAGNLVERDYWTGGKNIGANVDDEYWTVARTDVFSGALRLLRRETGIGRLLDIGGGVGHFTKCALDAGWDAFSVDTSPGARAAATARVGPDRALTMLPEESAGTFDVVTLWCVIAHVTEPRRLISQAIHALRPGGCLFLTTPNFAFQRRYIATLARLDRRIDFSQHDHLLHFTCDSITRLLTDCGIGLVRLRHAGVTEEFAVEPRVARWVVPVKRAFNRAAVAAAAVGIPFFGSELQVIGRAGGDSPAIP